MESRASLIERGRWLAWLTIGWNVVEGGGAPSCNFDEVT